MTTTFLPRFSAIRDAGMTRCMGSNHTDSGMRGICTTCLRDVVRVDKGDGRSRLFNLNSRTTAGDNHREDYACWTTPHECDQEFAARVQAERDVLIAAGDVAVIGARVMVIKGRKITPGTTGIVTWVGTETNGYTGEMFTKLRVADAKGVGHFVRASYCVSARVIPADAEIAAEAPVTPKPTNTPRATGSHADCSHEATKAARAACRRSRNV